MTVIIDAKNLVKKYGVFTAVDSISFCVEEGELFGFLGPNGAGKTTTMKMIQCISPLTSGSLSVFGMDVSLFPREIKSRIGVVPQETNLDPEFTCFENLLVYSRYFNIPKREAVPAYRGSSTLFHFRKSMMFLSTAFRRHETAT